MNDSNHKSEAIFWRSDHSKALTLPAEEGDIKRLSKYVNITATNFMLFLMYVTYVIAHPKVATTVYPILGLMGGQGSGKSWVCKLMARLIDPSVIGLQVLPSNPKDLAIAAQIAHILFFDNIRALSEKISDALCVATNGGAITSRELYTDAGLSILRLHVALVLNGIHEFMTESDLAQRCVPIRLEPIDESKRKSEAEMEKELQKDLPYIMRGLYECIAEIFQQLPNAEVTNPERMIGFVEWIAAYEQVKGVKPGTFQAVYSEALNQAQLDSLLEHPLPAAVIAFAEGLKVPWSEEPSKLLEELSYHVTPGVQRSSQWPSNAISLTKRLRSFQAALRAQGIYVEFGRGKRRQISISTDAMEEEY
jgi:hypothetical protein